LQAFRFERATNEEYLMKARVIVTLKSGVLDPQGQAIQGSLKALGFAGVGGVRQGKVFDIELGDDNAGATEQSLRQMCEKLLANTVIENYAIELLPDSKPVPAPEPPPAPAKPVEPAPVAAPAAPAAPAQPEPEPVPPIAGDIPIDAKVSRRSVPPPDGADLS
jgi:phosphoribosylformylglycinamidine synthase PurS subunit